MKENRAVSEGLDKHRFLIGVIEIISLMNNADLDITCSTHDVNKIPQ